MTDGTVTTRVCNTPGCGRQTPHPTHAYCSDCIGIVLRTSRPPELFPAWLRRIEDPVATGNTMNRLERDETAWARARAAA